MDEMELDISSMAHITGNSRTAARFRDAAETRKNAINSILWHAEMGQWLDYWLSDSMRIESKIPSLRFEYFLVFGQKTIFNERINGGRLHMECFKSELESVCLKLHSLVGGSTHSIQPNFGAVLAAVSMRYLCHVLWKVLLMTFIILVEPGTPKGSSIISQMRSHILWMEKRRNRKLQNAANKASKDLLTLKTGAFIVAPCPHDGPCPLQNTDKYCHFVQRLERTYHHSDHTSDPRVLYVALKMKSSVLLLSGEDYDKRTLAT